MIWMRYFILLSLFIIFGCGGTDLGNQTPNLGVEPGVSLSIIESSQSDFLTGTHVQTTATSGGALQIKRNIIGETGTIAMPDDIDNGSITTLNFRNTYVDPVVVAYIISRNDNDSLDVRINNVTGTSASIFYEDPANNGTTGEVASYIVMEKGRHVFANGLVIEAGTLTTAVVHTSPNAFAGVTVNFNTAFAATPVVLHTVNTYNNGDFISSVCDSTALGSFTLSLENAAVGSPVVSENIGWIAFSAGNDAINGSNYEINVVNDGSNDGVDDTPQIINFGSFAAIPDIVVKGNSGGGADGYWTRSQGTLTNLTHQVFAEEDQVGDGERGHANEFFAYAAFDANTNIGVYSTSASRTSAIYDLSSAKVVNSTKMSWTQVTPAGTSVVVETNVSLDGGNTWRGWKPVTNGGVISDLDASTNVSEGRLKYRITLSTTDEEQTASIEDVNISITAQ